MEGLYIITLLHEAFGFSESSRSITMALNIDGNEVEWTLGYALSDVLEVAKKALK